MHHLLNNGAEINQRDDRGWTPLHRAAHLAHYDGYLELYEYLLVRYWSLPSSVTNGSPILFSLSLHPGASGCTSMSTCWCEFRSLRSSVTYTSMSTCMSTS